MENSVSSVGRCPGCLRMSKLCKNGACEACQRFGPKYGALARRIRSDDRFRRKCYEMLTTDLARAEFDLMFSDAAPEPEQSAGPAGGAVVFLFPGRSGTSG